MLLDSLPWIYGHVWKFTNTHCFIYGLGLKNTDGNSGQWKIMLWFGGLWTTNSKCLRILALDSHAVLKKIMMACSIMCRYGEVVNINLVRDKATGKSKGYAFLCYEDQRSTVLAVDNLNSIKVSFWRWISSQHCSCIC